VHSGDAYQAKRQDRSPAASRKALYVDADDDMRRSSPIGVHTP